MVVEVASGRATRGSTKVGQKAEGERKPGAELLLSFSWKEQGPVRETV